MGKIDGLRKEKRLRRRQIRLGDGLLLIIKVSELSVPVAVGGWLGIWYYLGATVC
jgi:hypothetical protein